MLRGDKVYQAHRSHAYQYASRKYKSHLMVTLGVLIINLLWLLPWAVAVALEMIDGAVALLLAYMPLIWLAWYFRAGETE
jgi:Fuc2NAc and GlcNAc transferase